jgi:endonuclease/exonuclease/phosphatase family metal-dependent hydrolase
MRIVNWNINRNAPQSWQGQTIAARIAELGPDAVCLTEAHQGSLDALPGHVISTAGVSWANDKTASERLVLLWSRTPWRDVAELPQLSAIGGAVSGVTDGPLGPVRVVGLCVPYTQASPVGVEPKIKPWTHHVEFLDLLAPVLAGMRSGPPLVVLGDFNQQEPEKWGLHEARAAFDRAFAHLDIVTKGDVRGMAQPAIDHVAVSHELRGKRVEGFSRMAEKGPLSDPPHDLIFVELEAGGVQIFD